MITNETRATLIHPEWWDGIPDTEAHYFRPSRPYDTDANAVAELRAFVRARGKEREFERAFINMVKERENELVSHWYPWQLLDATPQQQTAAFDAVFRDDLERINES